MGRALSLLASLSLAGQLLVPLAAIPAGDGHGCTSETCQCAHRPPARPAAAEPCHGQSAPSPECQIGATCPQDRVAPLVASSACAMPAAADSAPPREGVQAFPPAGPATVRHGFARLDPHPPPAL